MNIKKDVESFDLIGEGENQMLKITFAYDTSCKRKTIFNKLSGKTIKILTENEEIPAWVNADTFNKKFPVGTMVKYYPIKGKKNYIISKTRTPAWELGCNTPVVSIEGASGGVALSHLEMLP